ncbi:MAG: AAA family ATPase [Microcystaceae cyanobacterium]
MLTRIYIDNFKTLVNFEIKFIDSFSTFLGNNGSGKSEVFKVLGRLQKLILDEGKVSECFRTSDLTRWEERLIQKFELELQTKEGNYQYSLEIEHIEGGYTSPRIRQEKLTLNDQVLAELKIQLEDNQPIAKAKIYNDQPNREGYSFPYFDWSQSLVCFIQERYDNKKLTFFKKQIANFFIVNINPFAMTSTSDARQEDSHPTEDMSNYVSWYNYLSGQQDKIFTLRSELQRVLDGFDAFRIESSGEVKVLSAIFRKPSKLLYKFHELSNGQKTLIALYTLIYCAPDEDYTLCIDEPENFIALPEIQPWLNRLFDNCLENNGQAILISHNPIVINFLATNSGHWFERQDNGVTRIKPITEQEKSGLSLAQLIELGWINDE